MRLPLIPPDRLSSDQKTFYDRALEQMERSGFTAFKTRDDDCALLGPWGVYIHVPSVAQAHYDEVEAITALKRLPENAKQVAILTAGARYKAAYDCMRMPLLPPARAWIRPRSRRSPQDSALTTSPTRKRRPMTSPLHYWVVACCPIVSIAPPSPVSASRDRARAVDRQLRANLDPA